MHELELVSHAAYASFYGDRALVTPGATCFRLDEAPDSPMVNRVVGLGLARPASAADIDAALMSMEGVTHYVAVSPHAAPPHLDRSLEERGLQPGWGWMLFERDPTPPPPAETALRIIEVGPSEARDWAAVVVSAYGLPDAATPVVAAVHERPGWACWLALTGDEPASAAALWVGGGAAYLGFAATMAAHRGRGGQGALLATRIERALELGATTIVTETGEQQPERPSGSYRNILRAGFRERYVVGNRLRRAPAEPARAA